MQTYDTESGVAVALQAGGRSLVVDQSWISV